MSEYTAQVIVIGSGISGLATAKCMTDTGYDVLLIEKSAFVGGLWHYSDKDYGVMKFTHINVSKANYSFSDFPFNEDVPDFPHNSDMAKYIEDYMQHFDLKRRIHFNTEVQSVNKSETGGWHITARKRNGVLEKDEDVLYQCTYVAIATGHHAKPKVVHFPGQDTFTGEIYHSIDFKHALINNTVEKKVIVVGIGNSAVDVACHCTAVGRCKPVYLSTRSGAWIVPNYVMGAPIDHYACRLLLWLPWQFATVITEIVLKLVYGNPNKYGLNPKMHAMQTQPTVSPTLIHHIQRGEVQVVPNVKSINKSCVTFEDGTKVEADVIVLCTGYSIHLPFLSTQLQKDLMDEDSNELKLYKNVFSPELDHTLAFIGFVQPASGGLIMMSEMQGRWWAELCRGNCQLPSKEAMLENIEKEQAYVKSRWIHSKRHTIQRDPIVYCDDLAEKIGCKPQLSWRLLLGCGGSSQYRLQGPGSWSGAKREVGKVKVTDFMTYGAVITLFLLMWMLYQVLLMLFSFITN